MNIIYNDTDITTNVQPLKLRLIDHAGGKPDSIAAVFADTDGRWSKWRPTKNDRIRVLQDGYDSGVMFIDHIAQRPGQIDIKALSIPQTAKTARTQGWENIRLLEIATEIANRYGFRLQTYNVINHLYRRVDQTEEADFAFLSARCELEGYALKINDRTLVIYDERAEEQKPANPQKASIRLSDMIDFEFADKSVDIYGKCVVRSQAAGGLIVAEHADRTINGPTLTRSLYAADLAEAMRWARGILRSYNKHRVIGKFITELRPGFAAGSSVIIQDVGMFDGQYFVDSLIHDLIQGRTRFTVRRPLEGY